MKPRENYDKKTDPKSPLLKERENVLVNRTCLHLVGEKPGTPGKDIRAGLCRHIACVLVDASELSLCGVVQRKHIALQCTPRQKQGGKETQIKYK